MLVVLLRSYCSLLRSGLSGRQVLKTVTEGCVSLIVLYVRDRLENSSEAKSRHDAPARSHGDVNRSGVYIARALGEVGSQRQTMPDTGWGMR